MPFLQSVKDLYAQTRKKLATRAGKKQAAHVVKDITIFAGTIVLLQKYGDLLAL